MPTAKRLAALTSALLLTAALLPATAQQLEPPANAVDMAIAMFPEGQPPFKLTYSVDFNMHSMGYKVVNYILSGNGKELGTVSRVMALNPEGPAGMVDVLVRHDKDGRILHLASLKPWKVGDKELDPTPLFKLLVGRKMEDLRDPLNVLLNGLAAGATIGDQKPLAQPPAGYKLDLTQKILTPGAKLPNMKLMSLAGQVVGTDKLAGPLVLFFAGVNSPETDAMVKVMETARTGMPQNPKVKDVAAKMIVRYVVPGETAKVQAYAKTAALDPSLVLVDTNQQLAKLFQVPFKPYCMMYEANGTLKYITPWRGEEELLGMIYLLCGGPAEGEGD